MFRHVVLFRWKPGTTAEQIEPIGPALRALAATLPGVRSYAAGPDLGIAPANRYDFAVVAEFEDKAAWDGYMADPEHDRIRAELIGPVAGERATAQFEG
jgi:quinol monooxygenase YgiN